MQLIEYDETNHIFLQLLAKWCLNKESQIYSGCKHPNKTEREHGMDQRRL